MEKLSVKGMIESILLDLAENQPIGSYALKIQMVSKMLKNEKLSAWLDKELNGYKTTDEVPIYRTFRTRVIADLIIDHGFKAVTLKNHEMPLYKMSADIAIKISKLHICDSVIVLSSFLINDSNKGEICYAISEYERFNLNKIYENCHILSAHKPISDAVIYEIIHKFKSTLLDIFMELNDTIFNDEIDFDLMAKRKDIEKIVTQTINAGIVNMGEGSISLSESTTIGGQNNTVTINSNTKAELKSLISQIQDLANSFEEEKDEVLNELARIVTQLDKPNPKTNIIASALQTINGIFLGVASNAATPVVVEGIQRILKMLKM